MPKGRLHGRERGIPSPFSLNRLNASNDAAVASSIGAEETDFYRKPRESSEKGSVIAENRFSYSTFEGKSVYRETFGTIDSNPEDDLTFHSLEA